MMRRKRERAGLNGEKKQETDIKMERKGERRDGGKKRENINMGAKRKMCNGKSKEEDKEEDTMGR